MIGFFKKLFGGKNESQDSKSNGASDDISVPMGCVIARVAVEEGQTVAKGEILFAIDAMQMVVEISAPYAGTVDKIYVRDGMKVKKGDAVLNLKSSSKS